MNYYLFSNHVHRLTPLIAAVYLNKIINYSMACLTNTIFSSDGLKYCFLNLFNKSQR